MTVLLVAPSAWHVAALAAGSVLKWTSGGRRVHIAVPGAGEEVHRVAEAIGAESAPVEWNEGWWDSDSDGRTALTDVFRGVEPELTISTAATSTGLKAAAIGRMVFDAGFSATVPHYRTPSGTPAAGVRTPIMELDDPFAAPRSPIEYVNTTSIWSEKWAAVRMSAMHVERADIPSLGGSPEEVAEIISRTRGLQIQAEHGEAFTQVRVYGRMRATRLMP